MVALRLKAPRAGSLLLVATLATSSQPTHASPLLFAEKTSHHVVSEVRVALSISESRTTQWTSYRLEQPKGDARSYFLLVVVPEGAAVDESDARWFQSLDTASAMVVLPEGSACETSSLAQTDTFAEAESARLDHTQLFGSVGEALSYLSELGYATDAVLNASVGHKNDRALLGQFTVSGEVAYSPVVRVVMPTPVPSLVLFAPTSPTDDSPVPFTLFTLSELGATMRSRRLIDPTDFEIEFDAKSETSNYEDQKWGSLSDGSVIVELQSRASLNRQRRIDSHEIVLPSLLHDYFSQRSECIQNSAEAFRRAKEPSACPEGALVAGHVPCADEGDFECGQLDELSMAMSGLKPNKSWLTRLSLLVTPGDSIAFSDIVLGKPREVRNVVRTDVLIDACETSGVNPTKGSAPSLDGPVRSDSDSTYAENDYEGFPEEEGCSCSGTASIYVPPDDGSDESDDIEQEIETESEVEAADTEEDCSSERESYDDDGCSSEDPGTTSEDDCSSEGSSSSADDCSSESTSESSDCSGDSTSSSSGDCGGTAESSGSGCSSSTGDSCSVAAKHRKWRPRLSLSIFLLGMVLAPLRRHLRPSERRSGRPTMSRTRWEMP